MNEVLSSEQAYRELSMICQSAAEAKHDVCIDVVFDRFEKKILAE